MPLQIFLNPSLTPLTAVKHLQGAFWQLPVEAIWWHLSWDRHDFLLQRSSDTMVWGIPRTPLHHTCIKDMGELMTLRPPLTNGRWKPIDKYSLFCLLGRQFWDAFHKLPQKILWNWALVTHNSGQLYNTALFSFLFFYSLIPLFGSVEESLFHDVTAPGPTSWAWAKRDCFS